MREAKGTRIQAKRTRVQAKGARVRAKGARIGTLALLALLGGLVPAVAGSETTPTIEAVNKPVSGGLYAEENHAWSPERVAVSPGAAVAFRNPSTVAHGVHWISGPATPSCTGSVPVGSSAAA